MMRVACVETYFYIQDFLQLAYLTNIKIQSILYLTFVSLSTILTFYWWDINTKGKTLQSQTQKKNFLLRLFPLLSCSVVPNPTKHKQALEEKN